MESEWTMFRTSVVEVLPRAVTRGSSVPIENPLVVISSEGGRQVEEGGL